MLEIAQADKDFAEDGLESNSILIWKRISNCSGQFIIHRTEFPIKSVVYKARIRMLDNKGDQAGLPSDNFFINVNP